MAANQITLESLPGEILSTIFVFAFEDANRPRGLDAHSGSDKEKHTKLKILQSTHFIFGQ